MVQFTPGPWLAEPADMFGDHNIVLAEQADDSRAVAAVVSNMRLPFEVAGNARLIAAAPDLYEAASKLIANFDELRATTVAERFVTGRSDAQIRKSSNEAIDELRAALSKARGEGQ